MNADEVGKLLGLMALADNRKPPEDVEGQNAMIAFWLEMVGDLTYADAVQAVRAHYRESRDWCMPADIRQRVNAVRFARLRENPPPPPPPELLDDPDAYRAWVREHGQAIADGGPQMRQIGGTGMTTITHANGHDADDITRPLPANLAAEQVALGGMLLSPDVIGDVVAAINPGDHSLAAHQIIHEAILRLDAAGEPVDAITVANELTKRGQITLAGGAPYLHTLIAAVPTAANAGYYARIVRDYAIRSRAVEVGLRITQIGYSGDGEAEELADRAVREAETICPVRDDRNLREAGRLFEDVIASLDREEERGLRLPWQDLNEALTGLAPGELVVVAGRPGMGKSIVGGQIAAWTATRLHAPVLLCSLEMSAEEIMLRLIAAEARVPLSSLIKRRLDEDDWSRIRRAHEQFSEAPLSVDDSAGATLAHIRARLRAMRRTGPAQLLVVDYLQLLSGPEGENRQQSVAALSTGLKRIAREFAIPVLVMAALNRNSESRHDKRPMPSDLRDSGQQEADADVIILLHREEMYDPGTADRGVIELIIAKNRQGPRCSVTLGFQGDYGRCVGLAKEDQWQN